jgi:hypothetical protein
MLRGCLSVATQTRVAGVDLLEGIRVIFRDAAAIQGRERERERGA